MGIKDRWKTIKSHGHYDTYSAHIADYPHYIYFRIYGHDTDGLLVRSQIVRWRTWGDG